MKMYYMIDDKRFLDCYMITERLNISKSLFQALTRKYQIEKSEVIDIQNKKLYSIKSIIEVLKKVVTESE